MGEEGGWQMSVDDAGLKLRRGDVVGYFCELLATGAAQGDDGEGYVRW